MYISHKHKLIFLRVPKTASSSLSEFLIRNLNDPDAIHTPVDDTNIRHANLPKGLLHKYKNDFSYFHLTLQQIYDEGIVTKEQVNTYKKIAVLREPIDRHLSFYHFYRRWDGNRKADPSLEEFKSFIPNGYFQRHENSKIKQSDFLRFNGQIVGDYWLYKNFEEKLYTLMDELSVKITHELPKHKSGFRKPVEVELVDDEMRDLIKAYYREDFEIYERLCNETH